MSILGKFHIILTKKARISILRLLTKWYIQNEYAQKLGHAGPVVPPVLLSGIITSSVSKLLPGPGSEVVNFSANFIRPVYHDEIVTFSFEVIKVDTMKEVVMISVEGSNRQNERVLDSVVMARPPRQQD